MNIKTTAFVLAAAALILALIALSGPAHADRGQGGGGGDGWSSLEAFHAKNAYLKAQRSK